MQKSRRIRARSLSRIRRRLEESREQNEPNVWMRFIFTREAEREFTCIMNVFREGIGEYTNVLYQGRSHETW